MSLPILRRRRRRHRPPDLGGTLDKKRPRWRTAPAWLVVSLVLAAVTVTASYLSKTPCSGPPHDEHGYSKNLENSYRLLCLTDIQALWHGRGVDVHQFPYVAGSLDMVDGPPGYPVNGAIEYPVLTGVFMWASGLPAANSSQYLAWNALLLLPVALLIGWQLATLSRWRALIWAAAPALVFYSVYNWDLLPVAWVLGAILAWRRRRYGLAAVCLGLGAATKIYPGFFLLPLAIERWLAGDRKGAAVVAGGGAGAWLAVNLPFMLINFDGWWATYKFQAGRVTDLSTNSIYFWSFPEWSPGTVDVVSFTAIAVCWALALGLGYAVRREPGTYPWLQVGAAMLFSFLAFNKVYSPQYFLWVLPLLAVIAVRWWWWLAYWVIDAVLFFGLLSWYDDTTDEANRQAAQFGGWGKTILLMALFFVVLRTPLAIRGDADDDADTPARIRDHVGKKSPARR